MRLFATLIAVLFTTTVVMAQTQSNSQQTQVDSVIYQQTQMDSALARIDKLIQTTNDWLGQIELDCSLKQRYKLYQTENAYTLLQLDTKTGKIKQVQWSLESEEEFSVTLNDVDLTFGLGHGSGSFELYPTKNIYQFILLDKTDGRRWHVQWGMKESHRWIN